MVNRQIEADVKPSTRVSAEGVLRAEKHEYGRKLKRLACASVSVLVNIKKQSHEIETGTALHKWHELMTLVIPVQ